MIHKKGFDGRTFFRKYLLRVWNGYWWPFTWFQLTKILTRKLSGSWNNLQSFIQVLKLMKTKSWALPSHIKGHKADASWHNCRRFELPSSSPRSTTSKVSIKFCLKFCSLSCDANFSKIMAWKTYTIFWLPGLLKNKISKTKVILLEDWHMQKHLVSIREHLSSCQRLVVPILYR